MSHLHFCKDKLCCDGLWFIKKMETYFILANYLLKTTLECYTYCSPDLLKVALFTFSFSAMINECNMRNSVTNHKLCFCFALNGLWGSLYCPPPQPPSVRFYSVLRFEDMLHHMEVDLNDAKNRLNQEHF